MKTIKGHTRRRPGHAFGRRSAGKLQESPGRRIVEHDAPRQPDAPLALGTARRRPRPRPRENPARVLRRCTSSMKSTTRSSERSATTILLNFQPQVVVVL